MNDWHACMIGSGGGRTLSKAFIRSPYVSLERRSHSWASIRLQFHVASTDKTKQTISLNRKWLSVFLHNEKEALQKWQCSVFVCNIAKQKDNCREYRKANDPSFKGCACFENDSEKMLHTSCECSFSLLFSMQPHLFRCPHLLIERKKKKKEQLPPLWKSY